MTGPAGTLILCSAPILAEALVHLLREEPAAKPCWAQPGPKASDGTGSPLPEALIVAPQTWEELARWLPEMQRQYPSNSWLLYSQLRVIGMFLSSLNPRSCTIVSSNAGSDELLAAFRALHQGYPLFPPAALLANAAQRLAALLGLRTPPHLTLREFECGCAASLGLRNRWIGAALAISEETVKKSVSHVLHKLDLEGREDLSLRFEQALLSSPSPQRV